MIIPFALAFLTPPPQGGQSIDTYVQSNLHDLTFTARVEKGDQAELKKINSDFGQSYRFKNTTVEFKEPFKLRVEAVVEDTHLLFINNGPIQIIRIPRAKINSRQNLATKPGRRQTSLDYGVLTPSLFDDFFVAKFVRMDRESGDAVFDMTYAPSLSDTSRSRVWLDPQKKFVVKREWYNQYGRQLATFFYDLPRKVDGVWIPTRLTVKNVDDVVAGVVTYDAIQANTGLADSLFD